MKRYMFLITLALLFVIGCQSTQQTESQAVATAAIKPILNNYEQLANDLVEKPVTEWSEGDRQLWPKVQQQWQSLRKRIDSLNDALLQDQTRRVESKMRSIDKQFVAYLKASQEMNKLSDEIFGILGDAMAAVGTASKDEHIDDKQDEADTQSSVGSLLNIVLLRQLLAAQIEIGQMATSTGIQYDNQKVKDLESQLMRHVIDYIKDVQTNEEAFRKGQNLVASYSIESGEYKSEIQLTIRVMKDAARKLGFNKAITQELLRPALEALDGKSSVKVASGQPIKRLSSRSEDRVSNNNDVGSFVKCGNAYYRSRQYDEAISEYNKAIELDSDYASAYYNRGNAFASLKKFEQAKKDLLKAVELNPALRPNVKKSSDAYKLNLKLDESD